MLTFERLGPYGSLEKIGQGGMAVVYRGVHETTGQLAAVKVPLDDTESLFCSLRTEVQALRRLRHPGIVQILQEGLCDPWPWYAMELLPGHTVRDRVREIWDTAPRPLVRAPEPVPTPETLRTGQDHPAGTLKTLDDTPAFELPSQDASLPRPAAAGRLEEVLRIALLVCEPLAHLHSKGIVHRDISARNLFLRPDGSVVIMDFGIASLLSPVAGRERVDAARVPPGAIPYVSPEQLLGKLADPRSDLYSLACVLYQLLTGSTPFVSMAGHLKGAPRPPSELVSGVPRALDDLVLALLEKDPRDRIGYADEVEAALRGILGEPPRSQRAPRRPYLYRPRIAGRDAQQTRVFDRIEGASGWRGWFGLVSGESGAGKTRFATAVAHQALGRQFRVVGGECVGAAARHAQHLSNAGPLHPLRPLLTAISDHCRERGRSTTDRILGSRARILARYEPSLLGLPGQSELPAPPDLPPHAAERRLVDALRDTVCAFADEVRLLLILDDLQWADELTLKLLMGLSEEVFRRHGLVILGTYRTEEASHILSQIADRAWVHVEHIGPIDQLAVRRMASDMLGVKSLPEPHVEVLTERSRGNPFFVGECLRMLVAEGHLRRREGQWEWNLGDTPLDALLPLWIDQLVTRRLRSASPAAAQLLRVAAVLGREIEVHLLAELAGMTDGSIDDVVSELVEARLLDEARGGRVRFTHDKIREVAYRELPAAGRCSLHAAAARCLARDRATGGATPHAAIAAHLRCAGDLRGARAALEKAANESLAAFAAADAIRSFQGALEIDRDLDDAVDPRTRALWLRQVARAYVDIGRSEESMRWVFEGLELLGWPVQRSKLGLLGATVVQAARLLARLARGPSRSISEQERADFLEVGSAAELLVPIFTYTTGKRLELFYAVLSHLCIAETVATPREKAWAYINAHVILGLLPFAPAAETCRRRAEEAVAAVPDPVVRSWIHLLTCVGATGKGVWERAITNGNDAAEVAEQIGFGRRWEEAQGMLCTAHLLHGDFERAIETSHQRFSMAALRGDVQTQLWSALGLAQAELNLGRTDRILERAEWIEQRLRMLGGRNERIFGHAVLAEAWYRSGDLRRALAAARAGAAAVHEGWPPVVYCVNAYSLLTNVLLELSAHPTFARSPERARLRREALAMCCEVFFSGAIYPVHRARCLLLWGRFAETADATGIASGFYEESLAMARKYDLPFDEGLAQLAIARIMPPGRGEREARLRAARELLSGARAAHEVARVDAELA